MNNRLKNNIFKYWAISCTLFGIAMLLIFLINIVIDGVGRLDWKFITDLPSRKPELAGIYTAIMGTVWILGLTAIIAIPIGVAAGIYLEEYGKKSRFANILEINITNLAGIPSIIYGILGLEVFVRMFGLGNSVIAGALTLSLLILPIIIVATREAIKAVPKTIREASFALGATKWQTISQQILPAAGGGVVTGVILALSRAIGETAPLIVVGALTYVPFVPQSPMDQYSVLPMQIFNWISRPEKEFATNAAAAIIVLLLITFIMNGFAIYLRNRWQKKVKW
ncbi:MAG: phosphate ABC transporter permease PstA [Chitinophagales bacterium]|jgi:phosphate transport system permease protein|nr:phosphate ABC transporter permease PstA [Bacteroidota bacterium]MBK9555371.1 phosphate ABC transporter permease PstA [Bacteroidota bacterium]MBL0279694.1 phosphate ABC transporter permease PstA [Bacteroidota bacterium]MBP8249579.1 phosphate ABC transporter permease PstA [Chitinophagales bacterium]MBP9880388.1 phosphate ABC transporter permease PstA [Chitinophagales bacterium]